MAQFGAGPELAAQCPLVPAPEGWRAWIDADGPIPEALAKRARALVDDTSIPLGTTESYPIPGVTTLIRLEPRVWARDAHGDLIQGCFRSSVVYLPTVEAPTGLSRTEKIIGGLTVVSLAVGIVATLATWGK